LAQGAVGKVLLNVFSIKIKATGPEDFTYDSVVEFLNKFLKTVAPITLDCDLKPVLEDLLAMSEYGAADAQVVRDANQRVANSVQLVARSLKLGLASNTFGAKFRAAVHDACNLATTNALVRQMVDQAPAPDYQARCTHAASFCSCSFLRGVSCFAAAVAIYAALLNSGMYFCRVESMQGPTMSQTNIVIAIAEGFWRRVVSGTHGRTAHRSDHSYYKKL
jgi:hypothetical protein